MISSLGIQAAAPSNYNSNHLLTRNALQPQNRGLKLQPFTISASSSSLIEESDRNQGKEKLGVVVKAMGRPRLVLRFIWMEKNIGIAIDQVIPGGRGTIPLSPYYFWPKRDAWEELKVTMEGKPWISYKQMVTLLNQTSELINLWQQQTGGK